MYLIILFKICILFNIAYKYIKNTCLNKVFGPMWTKIGTPLIFDPNVNLCLHLNYK